MTHASTQEMEAIVAMPTGRLGASLVRPFGALVEEALASSTEASPVAVAMWSHKAQSRLPRSALADFAGCDRRQFSEQQRRAAACFWLCDRWLRESLSIALAYSGGSENRRIEWITHGSHV